MTTEPQKTEDKAPKQPKRCFVIMPISDAEPYPAGHWQRVYKHLISPSCQAAGFEPILASEIQQTNFIALDILQRIISSEIVLCDLSSRNPNVFYELGIRQAFDKPAVLIKDTITPRVFDIQGLRDVEYDHSLRIDNMFEKIEEIGRVLKNTSQAGERNVNSLVSLLGMTAATLPDAKTISADTALILQRLGDMASRMAKLESKTTSPLPSIDPYANIRGYVPSSAINPILLSQTDLPNPWNISPTSLYPHLGEYPIGARVRLSSGREGTVARHGIGGSVVVAFDDGSTREVLVPSLELKIIESPS